MPNYELLNDEISTLPILTQNASGVTEPPPAGDVFQVVSNSPLQLNAVLGATLSGGPAAVLNALVPKAANLSFTVSDSAGLTQVTQMVDIVEDNTPTNIVIDFGGETHVPQPVPVDPNAPVVTPPIVLPPDPNAPTPTPQRRP